ncbi:unnamed protein product, partial [Ectocarpus sp. 13 AM-2016]
TPLAGRGAGEGGWLVLRKHLLQWLLAVSARCGDVQASSEYFAGLAELTAALEDERGKADRYLVTLPLPPSEGVSPGGRMLPPVPLVMEALGNVATASSTAGAAPSIASARESRVSWSDRMMRRATAEHGPPPPSMQAQQTFLPSTPSTTTASITSTSGPATGNSSRDAFLGSNHVRSPTMPASPVQHRFETLASDFLQPASSSSSSSAAMVAAGTATAAGAKKSRKISLPKSIGRKIQASRSSGVVGRREASFSATAPPLLPVEGGGGSVCAVAHRAALTLEEQWETLSDMALCTSRLSPEDVARVQLSGIPRLESARLLHLHGGLALLPGDGAASQAASASQAAAAAAAASSALFYNPFEEAVAGMDDEESDNGDGDIDS